MGGGPIEMRLRFDQRKSPIILASKIGQLEFTLRSFHDPLEKATRRLSQEIQHQFDVEGDPKWATLQPTTIKRKGAGDILERTGKLEKRAVQFARWKVTRDSAGFSLPNAVAYGYFHQTGFKHYIAANNPKGAKGSANVPARPFARLGQREQKVIAEEFDKWFDMRMLRVMK